ncbi:MAG: FUSC family protein [Clostridiales bacterium]|nr:FUSC family protein [Clostridiales bacterium]
MNAKGNMNAKRKFKMPPLFEPEQPAQRLHVGLRMVKTAIAVFVCALFGFWRGQPSFFSMIAAVICMQPTTDQTIVVAFDRTIGTLIGGLFGMAVIYIGSASGYIQIEWLYLFVVSLCIIPIILLTLAIRKPSTAAISCIVFIAVTIMYTLGTSPFHSAIQRMIDTEIGILVALAINVGLPRRKPAREAGDADKNDKKRSLD